MQLSSCGGGVNNPVIAVAGIGVVSPAGWGIQSFREALQSGKVIPPKEIARPGWEKKLHVRQVPPAKPSFLAHPRLRRTSPISQYAVAAALEALGPDAEKVTRGELRLGIIFSVMSGCVNYSRRFYDEALSNPRTASPLVFPETVFNAPSSHLAALLGTKAINYTIVGDPGTYVQGLALAAEWLMAEKVDGCLVIGAEEVDWITSDAFRRFARKIILSDGAGAVYLQKRENPEGRVFLNAVTDSHLFLKTQSPHCAAEKMRADFPRSCANTVLCDGIQGISKMDAPELAAWEKCGDTRRSVKTFFGEGLTASVAWQCVAGIDALQQKEFLTANISVVGCNQQAIGAQFVVSNSCE